MSTRARLVAGAALVIVGLAVDGTAIVGALQAGGARAASNARARAHRESTTTTVVPVETPEQFLTELANAFRTGNVDFLVSRLDPAVLARYGEARCRAALPTYTDPSAAFVVRRIGPPGPFIWTTGAGSRPRSTRITEAMTLDVDRTARGVTAPAQIHVARVGDHYSWFADCGEPVGR